MAGACYLGGGHLTPPSACFLICKMGEILSGPQGRCEGQREDNTHQHPARGLPRISQGARALSPDPARTVPAMKVPSHTLGRRMCRSSREQGRTVQAVGTGSSPCARLLP